ncbi:MAG: T9SS type A sorting domain-containing protein, partial [Polaribacter sp.]
INKSLNSVAVTGQTLPDTEAPSVPANVNITNITDSSFKVNWDTSTDNNMVTGYDIFVNGTLKASSTTTSYTVTGLSASSTYAVAVLAKDKDNNKSVKSTIVNATTTDGSFGGTASELFFSEYIEGTRTNKALEIVNLTGATVNLSGYELKIGRNGASVWTTPLALDSGTVKSIVPGDVFVVGNGNNSEKQLQPKSASNPNGEVDLVQLSTKATNFGEPVNFNGNDVVGLFKNGVLIDIIGVFGNKSNFAKDVTLRRKSTITTPDATYNTSEWGRFPKNTFSDLGFYTAATASTEDTFLKQFRMYPNPTHGNTLYFKTIEEGSVHFYDILGKKVLTSKITNTKKQVDISSLSKGVYLLKINTNHKSVTKKFIKN